MIAIVAITLLALVAIGLLLSPLMGLSAFWASASAKKDLAAAKHIERLLKP